MGEESPLEVDPSVPVPPWLVAHRERQAKAAAERPRSPAEPEPSVPPKVSPAAARTKPKLKLDLPAIVEATKPADEADDDRHWLVRWISRHSTISILVSLAVHAVVLATLAFIYISQVTFQDTINLWGVVGENEEVGSEMVIDTALPIDAGESAPLQMTDVSKSLESMGSGSSVPEMVRVGMGGKGSGGGEGGNGTSMGVPSLKIPGHAQTKGSFSAWTDPRDPKPNENYSIVIQMRLPTNVKKFRGSDLSGLVTGTDRYRQEIRFKSTDQFPVENGVVELRIVVPGGALRVRDTIRIESKLLREKQTFEIEF